MNVSSTYSKNNASVTLSTNAYSKSEQVFLKKAEKICKQEKRPFIAKLPSLLRC